MVFIKDVWNSDITDDTTINCWRHTGVLSSHLTRQGAMIEDRDSNADITELFRISNSDDIVPDVRDLVNEIHCSYGSPLNIENSFNYADENIGEEYSFYDEETAIISADNVEGKIRQELKSLLINNLILEQIFKMKQIMIMELASSFARKIPWSTYEV
jgi:hypothetical protein